MAQMSVRYEMEQKEREMEVEQAKNLELQKAYESLDLEEDHWRNSSQYLAIGSCGRVKKHGEECRKAL